MLHFDWQVLERNFKKQDVAVGQFLAGQEDWAGDKQHLWYHGPCLKIKELLLPQSYSFTLQAQALLHQFVHIFQLSLHHKG